MGEENKILDQQQPPAEEGGQQQQQPPQEGGGAVAQPTFDFSSATGGKFSDFESFNNEFNRLNSELEGRVKPEEVFASPIIARANDMMAKGATEEEVFNFMRISRLDPSKMDDRAAVIESLKIKYPNFSEKQIAEEYEDSYGFDPEDESSRSKAERALIKAAKEARQELTTFIGDVSRPKTVVDREAQDAKRSANAQGWDRALSNVKSVETPTVTFKSGDLNLDIKLPVNISDDVRRFVTNTMAGVEPTEREVQDIQQKLAGIAISADIAGFMKSLVETVGSKVSEHFVRKYENNQPIERKQGDAATSGGGGAASSNSMAALIRAARGVPQA